MPSPTKEYLHASDGTSNAALMHVSGNRSIGSTVLQVDTLVGVPQKFIATSGLPDATGFINPATATDFYGHINGSNLAIDGFCPGNTDAGNTIGQIVVIRPNTAWANLIADTLINLNVAVSPNLLQNGGLNNVSTNGYGGLADDWANSNANPVQGGFPTLTKQQLIDRLNIVDANIKGLWPLNGDFADLSSNGYNLTASGGPTDNNDGLMAQSKTFLAASSQYADNAAAGANITGSQTWSAWFKPTTVGGGNIYIAGIRASGGGSLHALYLNGSGQPTFELSGLTSNAVATSPVVCQAGKWYHIVGRYDSVNATLDIIVNGCKSSNASSGSAASVVQNFAVGRPGAQASSYANGSIQGVMVLAVALTDNQIKRLWNYTTFQGTKIRRNGTDGYVSQSLNQEKLARLRGQSVTVSALMYQSIASTAQISIYDGTTETLSPLDVTTGAWVNPSVTAVIPATATEITVRLKISTSNGVAFFRQASLVGGTVPINFGYSPEDRLRFPRLIQMDPPQVNSGFEFEEQRWYTGFIPTITASDSMTVGTPSNFTTRWMVDGKSGEVYLDFLPTIGGTLSYAIYATAPFTVTPGSGANGAARGANTSGFGARWTGSLIEWRKYDGGNLGAGGTFYGCQLRVQIP